MIQIKSCFAVAFLLFALTPKAHSFPENIRHGYSNCVSCHVSPTGGGLLTTYGRELSRELMSTWGRDGEAAFLYGVQSPEWLLLGGDYRAVQMWLDNPTTTNVRYTPMQADLEAGVVTDKWAVVATLGKELSDSDTRSSTGIGISRRHFVKYNISDSMSVRAGRFLPAFGLNVADHNLRIKSDLGWRQRRWSSETYNFEFAYIGEKQNLIVTGVFGRPEDSNLDGEKGITVSGTTLVGENKKLGAMIWSGETRDANRVVVGLNGIFGFTEHIHWLTEFDVQKSTAKSSKAETNGFVTYNRFGYEVYKGIHLTGTHEYSHTNTQVVNGQTQIYGPGFLFYPRPHFELAGVWSWVKSGAQATTNVGTLLVHYYF